MEIKYLQNLFIESKNIYANFKKENVLNSSTLKEMFSPEYRYSGSIPNTFLVKSLITNKPVEIKAKANNFSRIDKELNTCTENYQYIFYDKSQTELGYKYFSIKYNINNRNIKQMLNGNMETEANELYKGIGIREDEIQIKTALDNNIKYIPRSSYGPATLYHIKMGFLPLTDDLMEVKSEFDVNRYMNGIGKRSKDIKTKNFQPIIEKKDGRYYIDISKTQAVANVAEIKDRLAEGYSIRDLLFLDFDSLPLSLSGSEFEYWRNLINTSYQTTNL